MSYVDLRRFLLLQNRHTVRPVHNPIRAGISGTPEDSDYTSIQQRIQQWQQKNTSSKATHKENTKPTPNPVPLMPLVRQSEDPRKNAIGYTRKDYIELVDWAGRAIRDDKRGHISNDIPPILRRLNLKADAYLTLVDRKTQKKNQVKRQPFSKAMGSVVRIKALAKKLKQTYIRGIGDARCLYQIVE